MNRKCFWIFLACIHFVCLAQTEQQHSTWDDTAKTFEYMGRGAYLQFTGMQNLIMWGIAAGSVAYYLHNDKRILKATLKKRDVSGVGRTVSDMGIFFNTPIIPMLFYGKARLAGDEKMIRFAQEYLATLGLSLIECTLISAIPMHERPDSSNTDFWEEKFRQQSSFPSGHVVGYLALGVKAFQFYGPLASALPFSLAAITAYERVRTEKHYASDVIASGFITLLASEGVRMASSYQKNHPLYKWIYEHNFNIEYIRQQSIPGLLISFAF